MSAWDNISEISKEKHRRGFKFEEYCNEVQQFKYDEVNMIQLIYDYDTLDLPDED